MYPNCDDHPESGLLRMVTKQLDGPVKQICWLILTNISKEKCETSVEILKIVQQKPTNIKQNQTNLIGK